MKKILVILILLFSTTLFSQETYVESPKHHLVLMQLQYGIDFYEYKKDLDIEVSKEIQLDTVSIIYVTLIDMNEETIYYQKLSKYEEGKYSLKLNIYYLKRGGRFTELKFEPIIKE